MTSRERVSKAPSVARAVAPPLPSSVSPSPGMVHFLRSTDPPSAVRRLSSRADVLRAPVGAFGATTAAVRQEAVVSILSNPISTRSRKSPPTEASLAPLPPSDSSKKAIDAAVRLLPLLPESCFVQMAGGQQAYDTTPLRERQDANFRTLCKAVGKWGDAGVRLCTLIERLHEYRKIKGYEGSAWPLNPCTLSNFAVWLQVNSKKDEATSVAPRCISSFVSAATNICLPVLVESPHLGAVPAHQSSGDGYTGHIPLDIIHELEYACHGSMGSSPGWLMDCQSAYTIWKGSCRVQDWTEVSVADPSLAPQADSVYRIAVTKNGEKNTLFAVGAEGVTGIDSWRSDFNKLVREFGPSPDLISTDYDSPDCRPAKGRSVDSKKLAARLFKVIKRCAKRRGYSLKDLKNLHVVPHSLHGSMAAYAEAMEWGLVPVHKLGRWKIPLFAAAAVPVRKHKGAGRAGPKTISAVYSTAAECQIQLSLRCRAISALRTIGSDFTTHGDLSCFIENKKLAGMGFRGPSGHGPTC